MTGRQAGSQLIGFMLLQNFGLIIFGSVCASNLKILLFLGVFVHLLLKCLRVCGSVCEPNIKIIILGSV